MILILGWVPLMGAERGWGCGQEGWGLNKLLPKWVTELSNQHVFISNAIAYILGVLEGPGWIKLQSDGRDREAGRRAAGAPDLVRGEFAWDDWLVGGNWCRWGGRHGGGGRTVRRGELRGVGKRARFSTAAEATVPAFVSRRTSGKLDDISFSGCELQINLVQGLI